MISTTKLIPLSIGLLVVFLAFQIQSHKEIRAHFQESFNEVLQLRGKIHDLKEYIKLLDVSSDSVTTEEKESVIKNGVYDIEGHEPHAH